MDPYVQAAAGCNTVALAMIVSSALARHHGAVMTAVEDPEARQAWTDAEPEARAALLLSAAWATAGATEATVERAAAATVRGNFTPEGAQAADYTTTFARYARAASDTITFHGPTFPAMPLPGAAGALASSLGFDRNDLTVSLVTVLTLIATRHHAIGTWVPEAD